MKHINGPLRMIVKWANKYAIFECVTQCDRGILEGLRPTRKGIMGVR